MAAKKDIEVTLEEKTDETSAEAIEKVDTTAKKEEPAKEETVRFKIPKGRSDIEKQDVFVGVNGKSYLIKRGMEVEMPKSVIEVLENAEKQNEFALEYMEKVRYQEVKQE